MFVPRRLFLRASAAPRPLARRFHACSIRHHAVDMESVNTSERLAALRGLMKDRSIDVYSV